MPARVGRIGGSIAIAVALAVDARPPRRSRRRLTSRTRPTPPPPSSSRRITTLGGTTAFAARTGDATVYVTEQAGRVRAIRNGKLVARPVLDLQDDTEANGEQGLLGLAFAPDGEHLYVDYTDDSGDTHIDEFTMNGRVADKASRRNLLVVEQPQPNHNGGQLAFGPDGDLYIALGDGGAANDEGPGHASGGNGQSLRTLLGKILRIDPTPSGDAPYTVPAGNPFVDTDDALPGDLGVRAPQPVAVLVRHRHRRPVDRRRRAERVGRDRPGARDVRDGTPGAVTTSAGTVSKARTSSAGTRRPTRCRRCTSSRTTTARAR